MILFLTSNNTLPKSLKEKLLRNNKLVLEHYFEGGPIELYDKLLKNHYISKLMEYNALALEYGSANFVLVLNQARHLFKKSEVNELLDESIVQMINGLCDDGERISILYSKHLGLKGMDIEIIRKMNNMSIYPIDIESIDKLMDDEDSYYEPIIDENQMIATNV